MKRRTSALLILTIAVLSISAFYPIVLAEPDINAPFGTSVVIDGVIGTEWNDAGAWVVTDMGINHSIRAKHDGTYLYILLVVNDSDNDQFNVSDPTAPHDWAGVEFDLNGDQITHGNSTYPDDSEFCDYQKLGGDDWLTKGFGYVNRDSDINAGGTNDVVAAKGFNTTHTIWEFKKKLNSGDTLGCDIALDPFQTGIYGKDRIYIALAYQDGKTGKHYGCSHFYLLVLSPPPQYTLTIYSSPTGVTFTVDGVDHTAPWSGTYSVGTSVNLVMPATHPGYTWDRWSDGDTNRMKTVTMNNDVTLTGMFTYVPPEVVGGKAAPINMVTINSGSQIPWVGLSAIIPLIIAILDFMKIKKKDK